MKLLKYLLFFYAISLNAQIISGSIHDSKTNKIINAANIIIKETTNPNKIIGYKAVSNGEFSIQLKKNHSSVLIEIKSYGYYAFSKKINNLSKDKEHHINILLIENKALELEEIVITTKKKFFIKKDTVTYNVSAYKDGSERKVIDLIKKLPGIQVNNETGKIKYNGKNIETVLLEGDNLFGYNYTLGTKNINVDMIKQVQAIDKYSENRLLKGIENSDKVVLNLKLKKGKFDFSGDLDTGLGIFNENKQAFDINLNTLGITKKYKSFAILAYNNIGENKAPFNYFDNSYNIEQLKEKDFFTEKIISEISFPNILDNDRTSINNQYFGNYNVTFKASKRLKVKTNLYYIKDKFEKQQFNENNYVFDNLVITTNDFYNTLKKPEQYRGDVALKYNTSKSSLLEYNLRIKQENIKTPTQIISNNDNNLESSLNSDDFYFKQKILYTKKISSKKALQLSLFQSKNTILQKYTISPSVFSFNRDVQNVNNNKNYLEFKSTLLGTTTKNNKYAFSFGGIVSQNKLESGLFNETENGNLTPINNGSNKLTYSKKSFYQLGNYSFKYKDFRFTPSYAINYLLQEINNIENNRIQNKNNLILEPSFKISYNITNGSNIIGRIGYNQHAITEKYLFENKILTNNRLTIKNIPNLELQKSFNYGISYNNNDLYNQLQINFGVNFNKTSGNYFSNSLITENTSQITYFYLPQNNNSMNINFLIAKYIPFIESTIKLSSNYSISNYKNIINNSILRNNKSQFINSKLYIRTAFDGFINFENSINITNNIFKNSNNPILNNKSLNNTFKILLKPTQKWHLQLSSNYYLPNFNKNFGEYNFLDASAKYRPKNKKFDFSLTLKNLLNKTNFKQIYTTDYSESINSTNILPRYIILNMSFNF